MSYCVRRDCPQPTNPDEARQCQACGAPLLLRDRYRVERLLAEGGFGATFLARNLAIDDQPQCVIKQLRCDAFDPRELGRARELFEREAKTLRKVGDHPQIPALYDYFESGGEFYLVEEYVEGPTLQRLLEQQGPFTEAALRQFLSEMLPILQFLHERDVIHRDIKPANLIRRAPDRRLVLIDFGAVKDEVRQINEAGTGQTALTAFAIGTPGFAPPEQLAMRPVYASDLYSLGVTCLVLLTGRAPGDFDFDPRTGALDWRPLVQVSPGLERVLEKLLDISVSARFRSVADVLRALALEPYADSLAQGLAAARPQPGRRAAADTRPAPLTVEERRSPHEQLAERIRAKRRETANPPPQTRLQSTGAARSVRLTPVTFTLAYQRGERDFIGAQLGGFDLHGLTLCRLQAQNANLTRANLEGCDLSRADLGGANLQGCRLRGASLQDAYLKGADLGSCDLRRGDLQGANLLQTNLRGADLRGANLREAQAPPELLTQARTNLWTILPDGRRGRGLL